MQLQAFLSVIGAINLPKAKFKFYLPYKHKLPGYIPIQCHTNCMQKPTLNDLYETKAIGLTSCDVYHSYGFFPLFLVFSIEIKYSVTRFNVKIKQHIVNSQQQSRAFITKIHTHTHRNVKLG